MSRIGRLPIPLSPKVQVTVEGNSVTVKGPKGELSMEKHPDVGLQVEEGKLVVTRSTDQPRHRALHGLTRALLANMVTGVEHGFTRTLELQGVGYRAQQAGSKVTLALGFSHPVDVEPPPGVTIEVEGTSRIHVKGIDKQMVGQVAANIRKLRPPEPYKGKGIRYMDERVRRKAGKAGKAR